MKKYCFLKKSILIIRSLFFEVFMGVVTFFYSFVCLAARALPSRYRYSIVLAWMKLMIWTLKVICKVNYKIEGLEHIPLDRNGIILSKHQSTWETFLLPTLFHHTAIILKKELLSIPFFGWGLAGLDPIAINRKDPQSAMNQIITQGKKSLAQGRWILIFPEGTRTPPGQTGKYRLGGARLAVEAGCPVIPIAHNAGYYWPKGRFIKYPGTIQIIIGKLIETHGRTADDVMNEVQDWIEKTSKNLGHT